MMWRDWDPSILPMGIKNGGATLEKFDTSSES